jgi:hypothetical protein
MKNKIILDDLLALRRAVQVNFFSNVKKKKNVQG